MRATNRFLIRFAGAFALGGAVLAAGCGDAEAGDGAVAEGTAVTEDPMLTETAYGFDDLDMDGDSELDMNEIHEWAEDTELTYVEWAGPNDTTSQGLYETLFYRWDSDGDLVVSQVEWDANRTYFVNEELADVDLVDWDADGDAELVMSEVVAGFEATDLYARVDADADGVVSDAELTHWFFNLVDLNDDGIIDAEEWSAAERYYDPELMR